MYIYITQVVIICCCIIVPSKGYNSGARIVGGQAAAPGQFPYQAALQWNGIQRCGSAILNRKCVLTAGHCVQPANRPRIPAEELTVRVGTIHRYEGGQIYQVNDTMLHPKYDVAQNLDYDLCMVFLKECLTFDELVQPIPLAKRHVIAGRILVACGWGATSKGNGGEDILRYNNVTSVSPADCFKGLVVRPPVFCIDSPVGNGICNGDSGSAVAYNGVLVGIASFTRGGCGTAKYDGCAKVANMRSWIVKNLIDCI